MKTRTSFAKGQSGNPAGRSKGSRNRASLAVDTLLEGEAEALTRAAVEKALSGDPTALRICLDRIAPVRRDRPVSFMLPAVRAAADAIEAHAAILAGVAEGDLSPAEAGDLSALVDRTVRAVEVGDIHERLRRLEEGQA